MDTKTSTTIIFYRYNLFALYQKPTPLKYYGTKDEYYTLTEKHTKDTGIYFENEPVTMFFDNKIEKLDIQCHNCVRIVNKQTGEYNDNNNNTIKTIIWYSENNNNLGVSFLGFIAYYFQRENYKTISITNFEKKRSTNAVWVQDPYSKTVFLGTMAQIFRTTGNLDRMPRGPKKITMCTPMTRESFGL
ncbi:hypothetical protein BDF21DRAFT_404010 [Thamnidium elegans]|nr:hypothetical protein BDF21DRAFT_404010 [Thamnidium elegans]